MCAHVFRLLARRPVPWVLLENVPGLLCWHMKDDPPQPPAMAHIASELERLGYRWAQRVVGLTGFGIPQRRRRVFILASKVGDPRDVLLAPQAVCLGQCLDLNRRRHRSEDIDEEEARREEDDAADEGDTRCAVLVGPNGGSHSECALGSDDDASGTDDEGESGSEACFDDSGS